MNEKKLNTYVDFDKDISFFNTYVQTWTSVMVWTTVAVRAHVRTSWEATTAGAHLDML